MSETAAARLETTRKLDAFYLPYRQWSNFLINGGCCITPAVTLVSIPTYILLWTDGPYIFSLLLGGLGWIFGGIALMIVTMTADGVVSRKAARQFDAAFPRDSEERRVAVDILQARLKATEALPVRTLLQTLGELPADDAPPADQTVEQQLSQAISEGDELGAIIPIEDDGAPAAPVPTTTEKAGPPRLRYIPLEPERDRDPD